MKSDQPMLPPVRDRVAYIDTFQILVRRALTRDELARLSSLALAGPCGLPNQHAHVEPRQHREIPIAKIRPFDRHVGHKVGTTLIERSVIAPSATGGKRKSGLATVSVASQASKQPTHGLSFLVTAQSHDLPNYVIGNI